MKADEIPTDLFDLVRTMTGQSIMDLDVDNKVQLIKFTLFNGEKLKVPQHILGLAHGEIIRTLIAAIMAMRAPPDQKKLVELADIFVGEAKELTTSRKVYAAAEEYQKLREGA